MNRYLSLLLLLFTINTHAQDSAMHHMHDNHHMHDVQTIYQCPMHPEVQQAGPGKCPKCKMDLQPITAPQMHSMDAGSMGNMSHAYSLNLPMARNGSGTGWLPDASPMYGAMYHSNKWMYMLHGNIFLRYNNQDFTKQGSRGNAKVDAPNWLMFMGQRKVGQKGLFHFSSMLSLDLITMGNHGYPLLFQTGETYKGEPLVDRQHPHDLFSELSVSYAYAISPKADVFAYVGYPGEPALGPVAFMHRPSALNNPDAPLSHHWVDATHVTFGVATLGLRYNKLKLEGSLFTGREPDEKRYDFDKPRFDSWSTRLSLNPNSHWALQASHAFVKAPETLHPHNVHRTTASAIFSKEIAPATQLDATMLWGMNKVKLHEAEHAALAEAALRKNKTSLYARYEMVQKSTDELHLSAEYEEKLFPVNSFTAGAAYTIFTVKNINADAGGQLSLYHPDKRLAGLYGKNPLAVEIYLRLYPALYKK